MKKTFSVASLGLLLLAVATGCAPSQTRSETKTSEPAPQLERVERYEKFEVELDDGDSDVTARFVEPDGDTLSVGGFDDGERRLVRFTPVELGDYTFTVVDEAGATLADGAFEAVEGERPGFVRLDDEGGYPGLEHDDGSAFVLLGENRINIYDPSWNWQEKDIDEYVAYMAENGMTTLRVFVFSDCENEESDDGIQPGCLEPEVGEFDPEVARRFDEIFEAAEEQGIYVVLVPFAIGFSPPDDTWKSWEDNPYSAERGGPAETRFAFFDDADVRDAAFERFRYVVNRWGYSPNLLAIDLLNEPEWDGEISEETWTPWAQEMAERIERIDPYDHLITVGPVGLHWNVEGDEHAWWGDEKNDLVQWHRYGPEIYDVHNLAAELSFRTDESRRHDKPIFCGEFGYGGDPAPYDHTQVGLWSLTMSGAGALAHSAPPFNVDSDEYMTPERAAHFAVLADFLEPLLEHAPLFADPVRELGEPGARMWTLRGDDAIALWVMGAKEGYGDTVEAMQVDVHLPKGQWDIEWVDDSSGEVVGTKSVSSAGQPVVLKVPKFERHIAARVIRSSVT